MKVTVEELLNKPFSARTQIEKQHIVEKGKPRPPFALSVGVRQLNGEVLQTQRYNQILYDILPWITRCDERQSFFCWPCLLFMPGNEWSKAGVADGHFVVGDEYDHGDSPEHIQAMLDYHTFIKNHVKLEQVQSENRRTQLNRTVKKNRQILKHMIDAMCNVIMKTKPFNRYGNCNQLRKEDCISVLEVLRNHDIQYVDVVDGAINLLNQHPNFLHDLVDAVTSVIKSAFKKETQLAKYVSVILSNHSEISSRSQISTILRYIKAGKACERFVGFINMAKCNNADEIFKTFKNTVSEFGIKERVLSQSVVHTSNIPDLLRMLKAEYPYSFFVPYYGHGLNYIFQQSVLHIKECGLFFKTLNEIGNYFRKGSKQWEKFDQFMVEKFPHFCFKWYKRSQLVKIVNKYRKHYIGYFTNSERNCEVLETDLLKVRGFKTYLEHFDTVFLLRLFARLFEVTAFEDTFLKLGISDNVFNYDRMEQLRRNLRKEQETGFIEIWSNIFIERDIAKKDIKVDPYRELFNKIIDSFIQETTNRFDHLGMLRFCLYSSYKKSNQVSVIQSVQQLPVAQHLYFDEKEMEAEFEVLRNSEFAKKSVSELLELFVKRNLNTTFPNISKLAELSLTLPIGKSISAGPSKLRQITNWIYTSEENVIHGDASILFIEKDFLKELKRNSTFKQEVIFKFNSLSNYMKLIYQYL